MTDIFELIRQLCTPQGVSGNESDIGSVCEKLLGSYGTVKRDALGNVLCEVGEHDDSKKTLLLNAHIDEIGMIVNYITEDGFLRVSKCGGIDARVLPASQVTIYGKETLKGVMTSVPPHLQKEHDKTAPIDELYVDTGLSGEKAKELISLGDRVLIENEPAHMGELVTSKALDDRVCAAAVISAVERIAEKQSAYNIKVLFSVCEEVGGQGAKTGAFTADADLALVFDVSFGRVHGETEGEVGEIGKGTMIGISPVLSRRLSNCLCETAEAEKLSWQPEVMGGRTGTDADAIAVAKGGVPACTVSIPIKYMHTPVEAVKLSDVEQTAALAAAFCERGLF